MSGDTTGKSLRNEPATDWRRLHEMTDAEVAAAIADDPDLNPLNEEMWREAGLVGRPSKAARSAVRFERAVTRIAIEACWLRRYQSAIDKLQSVKAVGTDFFRVALNALLDARLVRLIRLLEEGSGVVSFWYLDRANPQRLKEALEQAGLDLARIKDISEKLRAIRNRAFIHIDKRDVFDPQRLYDEAGIRLQDLSLLCSKLQKVMEEVYRLTFGRDFEYDEYDGSDIPVLARLRDVHEEGSKDQSRPSSSSKRPLR